MKNNAARATKAEKARNDILLTLHCICCTLSGDFRKRPLEVHHIVRGNKRLGHWFTLQLCVGHHKGEWTDQPIRVGIASGRHAFKEAFGYDELELWQRQQVALRLDDTLPGSKIVRRRHVEMDSPRMALASNALPSEHAHAGKSEAAAGAGRDAS